MTGGEDEGMVVARIVIERTLYQGGHDLVTATTEDETGDPGLPAIVALGMLRLAEGLLLDDAQYRESP